MSIIVSCICGQRFQADDHLAGRQVPCPACGEPLLIPDLSNHSLVELVDLEATGPTERIPVACSCGKRFRAEPNLRDKIISCPSCGQAMLVGAAAPVAPRPQVSINQPPRANSYFPPYQYPTQPLNSVETYSNAPTYSYAPPAGKDDERSGNGALIAVTSVGIGLLAIAVVAILIVVSSRQDDRPATVSKQSVPPTTSRDNRADIPRDQPKNPPALPGSRPDPQAATATVVFKFTAYRGKGNATDDAQQALARFAWAEIGKAVADLEKKTITVPSRYKPDDLPSAKYELREAGFENADGKYSESGK